MRLGREVLEEERVHRALEADMQLVDLAFGEGHQRDAGEIEALVERRHVLLVAAQPVERLGDDQVELAGARILDQLLIARRKVGAADARDRCRRADTSSPRRSIRSRHSRSWSSIEASRCRSEE